MTELDLSNAIDSLDANKSPGIDNIHIKHIKKCKHTLSKILLKLINLMFETAVIHPDLKTAIIRPVHKSGSKAKVDNYRPIAVLPVIDKIMERYVANILINYLEKYNILSPNQYAFQKKKSTITLLEAFSDEVNRKLNDGYYVCTLFLDLSKAFDTLDHNILLNKLYNIGIRGTFLNWFKSYLSDRFITTRIHNIYSEKLRIPFGVPHGSILGPLLFLIYINDINDINITGSLYQYADDTVILSSNKCLLSALNNLQYDFNILNLWFNANSIHLNAKKTKYICFHTPGANQENNLSLCSHSLHCQNKMCLSNNTCTENCSNIEMVRSIQYLGLTLDHHFRWKQHIMSICNKLRYCSVLFSKVQYVIPLKTKILIYKALCESIIGYGITIYGCTYTSYMLKIESLQYNIMKLIVPYNRNNFQLVRFSSSEKLGILTARDLYRYKVILKHYYSSRYKIKANHYITTRFISNQMYIVPSFTNNYGRMTQKYQVPYIFNEIPRNLLALNSFSTIKHKIKNWIFHN